MSRRVTDPSARAHKPVGTANNRVKQVSRDNSALLQEACYSEGQHTDLEYFVLNIQQALKDYLSQPSLLTAESIRSIEKDLTDARIGKALENKLLKQEKLQEMQRGLERLKCYPSQKSRSPGKFEIPNQTPKGAPPSSVSPNASTTVKAPNTDRRESLRSFSTKSGNNVTSALAVSGRELRRLNDVKSRRSEQTKPEGK